MGVQWPYLEPFRGLLVLLVLMVVLQPVPAHVRRPAERGAHLVLKGPGPEPRSRGAVLQRVGPGHGAAGRPGAKGGKRARAATEGGAAVRTPA